LLSTGRWRDPRQTAARVNERERLDDVVQNFVIQQFAQAIQRANSIRISPLFTIPWLLAYEKNTERLCCALSACFPPAVPDPEGMGTARTAEASRRKERREQGRQAQTLQTRIETATSLVTKKLREALSVKRRNHPKLRINLLDRGRTGLALRMVKKRMRLTSVVLQEPLSRSCT